MDLSRVIIVSDRHLFDREAEPEEIGRAHV